MTRLWKPYFIITALFMSFFSMDPHAAGVSALTLEECVQIALEKNPSYRVAASDIRISQESIGIAESTYYPTLDLNAGYRRWETHIFLPEGLTQQGIPTIVGPTNDWSANARTSYLLFDNGKRKGELGSAVAQKSASEEQSAGIRQDVIFSVHQGYFALLAAMEEQAVAQKSLDRSEDHLSLTEARKAAGAVPQADVTRARVEVANAKLTLVHAENAVRIARGNLNRVMGLPAEQPLDIVAQTKSLTVPQDIDVEEVFRKALTNRQELKAADQRIESRKNLVNSAKGDSGPKVKAEGGFGWRDSDFLPEDKDWWVGTSVAFSVFDGHSKQHKVGKAQAELSREEAERNRLALDVRQEVWIAYSRLQETYEAVKTAEVAKSEAEESLRLTQARYAGGAGTFSDLLDSEAALSHADASYVQALYSHYISQSNFIRSIGDL